VRRKWSAIRSRRRMHASGRV